MITVRKGFVVEVRCETYWVFPSLRVPRVSSTPNASITVEFCRRSSE